MRECQQHAHDPRKRAKGSGKRLFHGEHFYVRLTERKTHAGHRMPPKHFQCSIAPGCPQKLVGLACKGYAESQISHAVESHHNRRLSKIAAVRVMSIGIMGTCSTRHRSQFCRRTPPCRRASPHSARCAAQGSLYAAFLETFDVCPARVPTWPSECHRWNAGAWKKQSAERFASCRGRPCLSCAGSRASNGAHWRRSDDLIAVVVNNHGHFHLSQHFFSGADFFVIDQSAVNF